MNAKELTVLMVEPGKHPKVTKSVGNNYTGFVQSTTPLIRCKGNTGLFWVVSGIIQIIVCFMTFFNRRTSL